MARNTNLVTALPEEGEIWLRGWLIQRDIVFFKMEAIRGKRESFVK